MYLILCILIALFLFSNIDLVFGVISLLVGIGLLVVMGLGLAALVYLIGRGI